jgi:hypothetical protein
MVPLHNLNELLQIHHKVSDLYIEFEIIVCHVWIIGLDDIPELNGIEQ